MSDNLVFLIVVGLIFFFMVIFIGAEKIEDVKIKKSQACFEKTKRNECWEIK